MTSITLTDYDIPFNRFDQPLLGVASDAVHLVVIWPATSLGLIDKLDEDKKKWPEAFKRELLKKQRGRCPWTDCNDPLDLNDKLEVDHVWPISKGGRHWVLNLQLLHKRCNQKKAARIDFALKNISPLLPHLVLSIRWLSKHPRLAGLIVGGIALVIAIAIVVKWLREYVNGMRRYLHLLKSAQDSLTRTATTVSRHLESAGAQALQVQSTACGFAVKARGIAGQLGRETTHRLITTAGEMPGRFGPAATRIRDASPESLAEPVGLALRSARHAGGSLGDSARTAAGRVKSRAYRAPGLVRGATERVSDMLPRPHRKTRTAFVLST